MFLPQSLPVVIRRSALVQSLELIGFLQFYVPLSVREQYYATSSDV